MLPHFNQLVLKRLYKLLFYFQPNPYEHTAVCYYSTNGNNPILILAPVKVEEIYKNPDIMLFHDVISDNEMKIVKGMATPKVRTVIAFYL